MALMGTSTVAAVMTQPVVTAVPGETLHEATHGVGDSPRLVQYDDPPADRTDRFCDGEPQHAAVDQWDGLGTDVGHALRVARARLR